MTVTSQSGYRESNPNLNATSLSAGQLTARYICDGVCQSMPRLAKSGTGLKPVERSCDHFGIDLYQGVLGSLTFLIYQRYQNNAFFRPKTVTYLPFSFEKLPKTSHPKSDH